MNPAYIAANPTFTVAPTTTSDKITRASTSSKTRVKIPRNSIPPTTPTTTIASTLTITLDRAKREPEQNANMDHAESAPKKEGGFLKRIVSLFSSSAEDSGPKLDEEYDGVRIISSEKGTWDKLKEQCIEPIRDAIHENVQRSTAQKRYEGQKPLLREITELGGVFDRTNGGAFYMDSCFISCLLDAIVKLHKLKKLEVTESAKDEETGQVTITKITGKLKFKEASLVYAIDEAVKSKRLISNHTYYDQFGITPERLNLYREEIIKNPPKVFLLPPTASRASGSHSQKHIRNQSDSLSRLFKNKESSDTAMNDEELEEDFAFASRGNGSKKNSPLSTLREDEDEEEDGVTLSNELEKRKKDEEGRLKELANGHSHKNADPVNGLLNGQRRNSKSVNKSPEPPLSNGRKRGDSAPALEPLKTPNGSNSPRKSPISPKSPLVESRTPNGLSGQQKNPNAISPLLAPASRIHASSFIAAPVSEKAKHFEGGRGGRFRERRKSDASVLGSMKRVQEANEKKRAIAFANKIEAASAMLEEYLQHRQASIQEQRKLKKIGAQCEQFNHENEK